MPHIEPGSTASRVERLYPQIRRIAGRAMRHERVNHTLQPTAIASEVFIKLSSHNNEWKNDAEFIGAVIIAVRRVLIEYARARRTLKRGRDWKRIELTDAFGRSSLVDVLAFDDLLTALSKRDSESADIFMASIIGGYNDTAIAALFDISQSEVKRRKDRAQAWLMSQLNEMDT